MSEQNSDIHAVITRRVDSNGFVLAICVCLFNTLAARIYVYIQFFSAPFLFIIVAQLTWQGFQNTAPIIFLIFYENNGKDCLRMINLKQVFSLRYSLSQLTFLISNI
ncbi:hypothetical protein L596_030383 [Steinernema carpocapsae]|uniref:7TM GPCR serpentine receptor class x (Srx) domain-containing protein n=1 Tax=Steinernema carpocapsae TaxID=34508 RepID=A0A4U5LP80_STECR|nr:hypothetical protein L596_030383 [Steinernema carpocapsae]